MFKVMLLSIVNISFTKNHCKLPVLIASCLIILIIVQSFEHSEGKKCIETGAEASDRWMLVILYPPPNNDVIVLNFKSVKWIPDIEIIFKNSGFK